MLHVHRLCELASREPTQRRSSVAKLTAARHIFFFLTGGRGLEGPRCCHINPSVEYTYMHGVPVRLEESLSRSLVS
jgi:hypothetical protein